MPLPVNPSLEQLFMTETKRPDVVAQLFRRPTLVVYWITCIVAAIGSVLGSLALTTPIIAANPSTMSKAANLPSNASPMWKENYTVEYPAALPVSVAFSADGKVLLTGDTAGEVMALIFTADEPQFRWKSKV